MRRVMLAALLVLAGCDHPNGAPPTASASPAPSPTRVSTALYAIPSTALDNIVIDARGFVVYRSDRDTAAPSRSSCVGDCLLTWLLVPCADDIRVEGIDRQLVSCLDREDGRRQLTLGGWPLYGYSGDRMPGDTNGHGQDEEWFAVSPQGNPASFIE